jgi:hypothetical protein
LGEVIIEGKQKVQFRDKYMGYLDSVARIKFDNGDYVCIDGHLNCPVHRDGRFLSELNKKPVEGEKYIQWLGFEWHYEIGGAYSYKAVKEVIYHYPDFTDEFLMEINNLTKIKGYYPEREFYQPNYDKTDSTSMIPDYRNTLLWAPTVLTDRNGEAQLEFFCSDIYTGFVGIIEGVSGDGKLGSESFEFKVLKTKPFGWEK